MSLYKKRIFIGFVTVIAFCALSNTYAQRQPVIAAPPLLGDSVKVGKITAVADTIGLNPLYSGSIRQTNRIDNIISLHIDGFLDKVLPDSFSVTVRVQVNYTNQAGTDSTYDTLKVNYHKNYPGTNKAAKIHHNWTFAQLKVLEVSITDAPPDSVRRLLVLENMMSVERYFTTSCSAVPSVNTNAATIATDGELSVSWPATAFISLYELEWAWVDKAALDSGIYNTNSSLDPNLVFKNNSTRVQLSANSYKIPVLYDGDGTLFSRVRTLQYAPDNEIIPGLWSTESGAGGLGSYVSTGHQPNLNWQATTSYAEQGKRKSVVTYYSGDLLARQIVTKDNTTGKTVIAETLYDKQGRPAIQVLPAPTLKSLIGYDTLFNRRGINTAEYDKSVYDTLIDGSEYCAAGADSMSSTSGTTQYYSTLNPLLTVDGPDFHQYIPDAKGFAFAETRYTRDNTGRIDRQGGVGDTFRIGSGHETKYYYGSAEQKDIDALFGTEAGDASHYEKNMVRDANGQYSISYVDMHGRTVATALAGDATPGLQRLSSYDSTMQTDSLLTTANNVIKDNTISSTRSILVPTAADYKFKYSLSPESLLLDDCKDSTICYDCLYDLTITITDICGNEGFPKVIKRSNFSLFKTDSVTYNLDTTCMAANTITIDTSFYLEEGSYDVTKVLSVSKPGMMYYRDSMYVPHNTCKSYERLILDQLDSIRQRIVCEPDSAVTHLATAYREQMMMDLTPLSGQYADSAISIPPSQRCFSIFDTDPLTGKPYYQYPLAIPKNLTPEEFIARFEESWAEALLPVHPEYRLLVEYEKLQSAYRWEADFFTTTTFADAVAKGYLNPTGSASAPASQFTVSGKIDSLFIDLAVYGTEVVDAAKQSINESLVNFVKYNPTQYYNIWGFATAIVKCNNGDINCYNHWHQNGNVFDTDSLCEGDLNQAWRMFQSQYLRIREDWIDNFMRQQTGIYASQSTAPCIPVFPDRSITAYGYNVNPDADPPGEQYGGYNGTAGDATTAQNNLESFLMANCRAYAEKWWADLAPCGYLPVHRDTLINRLILVAYEGADQDHPFGSSTVKPSSTYIYRSFDQVIEEFNDEFYPNVDPITCNAYLIPNPRPYEQPAILVNEPLITAPDSCSCARINELYTNFQNQPATYSSFSDYMLQAHGTTISNSLLDSLRNLCNNPGNCTYLESPILLPPALQCGTGNICADCVQVNAANDLFKARFPNTVPMYADTNIVQRHINKIYTNFMNHQLGFAKYHGEYLAFLANCAGDTRRSNECNTTGWTIYHSGFNFDINNDLYINAYNNVNSDSLFFNNGMFNSPAGVYVSHYVLVNKKDSVDAGSNTVLMQWRVKTSGTVANPFAIRGDSVTYFGAEWLKDPADTAWWIGYTRLNGTNGNIIKAIGLQAGSSTLKADWVKITALDSTTVLYVENFLFNQQNCGGPFLCGSQATDSTIILNMNPCADTTLMAIQGATYYFDIYREKLKTGFEKAYMKKCLDAGRLERFTMIHPLTEYHYTLYYYDQAGNLVKTVPPEGARPVRDTVWLDSVKTFRNAGQVLRPAHTLATTYRYNSLNQVISQHSPDGGLSRFWYDRLGRLVVSQNAQQAIDTNYSYTLYDSLGRITEVGQKKRVLAITDAIARNQSSLKTWLEYTYTLDAMTVVAEQVTKTVYDTRDPETTVLPASNYVVNPSFQKAYTLRNRVSHTRFYEKLVSNGSQALYSDYDNSSIYSYDIHGNVDTLLQHYRTGLMADNHMYNQFKTMAYRYDPIGGKVNEVHYQPGMADELYHRYEYDAENRLTDVYTADRKPLIGIPVLEEHEARYSYYRHGPLARVVIGQEQVQGVDYAYTLQGWLKGVNSDSLLDKDGVSPTSGGVGGGGSIVAKDAYRFSLNYFNGDYKSIGQGVASAFPGYSAYMGADYRPLYNGNISSMVVGIPKLGETKLYNYGYDQLNRIVSMDAWKGYNTGTLSWSGIAKTDEYKERIGYDANGNILKYLRNGHAGKLNMDSLTYEYDRDVAGLLVNNRLRQVKDSVRADNYTEDIDSQSANNYTYDAIGNLVSDTKDSISNIQWTVYGKIRRIIKTNGTVINYTYDVSGNRISKAVTKNAVTTTTWYVRDAQGNPMAIYTGTNSSLTLSEHQLYGNSRLGVWNRDVNMDEPYNPDSYAFERGNKFYELSNHLGNVLVTVSDMKFGHNGGGGIVDYYTPDVVSASDYYPFGMQMVGRKFDAGKYRYGFNGKENDNDVKGEGNQQDYGMRINDPRVGRFLSVDPLTRAYPWYTPYQYAGNKPIWCIDLDGLEEALPKQKIIPMLTNVSESTCIGCRQKSQLAAMRQDEAYVERLKAEYDAYMAKGGYQALVVPSQYQRFLPNKINQGAIKQGGFEGSDQYIIMKERVKVLYTLSQYAPVTGDLHDLKDVVTNLSKGDFAAAGLSAVFLIPGSDFLKPIKSLVKADKQLLKLAKQTFDGNKALSKEATDLVDKFRKGLDGGIGGHEVFKGVSELRGKSGARVYYRETKEGIEILGYSNKNNQQAVIDRLKKVYGTND